jgi:hypothetical protein
VQDFFDEILKNEFELHQNTVNGLLIFFYFHFLMCYWFENFMNNLTLNLVFVKLASIGSHACSFHIMSKNVLI